MRRQFNSQHDAAGDGMQHDSGGMRGTGDGVDNGGREVGLLWGDGVVLWAMKVGGRGRWGRARGAMGGGTTAHRRWV